MSLSLRPGVAGSLDLAPPEPPAKPAKCRAATTIRRWCACFAGVLGIIGAVHVLGLGLALREIATPFGSSISDVFGVGSLLVAAAVLALQLNVALLVPRRSRGGASLLLVGVGCLGLTCLGGVIAIVITQTV